METDCVPRTSVESSLHGLASNIEGTLARKETTASIPTDRKSF